MKPLFLLFSLAIFAVLLPGGRVAAQAVDPTVLPAETPAQGRIVTNFAVDRTVFGGGSFYYAILNETTRQVVARGQMDVEGIDRIILAPETPFRMLSFYAETLAFGFSRFTTPPSGSTFQIPCMDYRRLDAPPDADNDGLADDLELIAGTNPNNRDTDGDGFDDGPEVTQGKNPLDGFVVATGIVASGPTPGSAVDICTINNIAIVACGADGIAVFNVKNGAAPVRLAVVDTPGQANGVTCYSSLVGVADGSEGLAIIDTADAPASRIIHQLRFGSPATCVTARGHYAFVGLADGRIIMVDMFSGTELGRYNPGWGLIEDLAERRGLLYALAGGSLLTLRFNDGDFEQLHRANAPGGRGAGGLRLRLFLGDDYLLACHTNGVNRYSLANPEQPLHLGNFANNQFGWKQMVGNGGGLAVAAVSPNSTPDGAHDVDLYNAGATNTDFSYVRTFETPGLATSVSLYNGLAYVADGTAGLQVINYLAFDTGNVPPTGTMTYDNVGGNVEEGKLLSVRVKATDDVQVRNVEFFIDGVARALDGNFPYELGLLVPAITGTKNTFTLGAVITDTGGNATTIPPVTLNLVPDATPPRVRVFRPPPGAVVGQLSAALATFSEPIRQSTSIIEAGPDKILRTPDDVAPAGVTTEYQSATDTLAFRFDPAAAPGLYEATIRTPLADRAGNEIATPFVATFRVYGFADADQDGVPDDLEPSLNLDPTNPDTNNNNVNDGLEDFDGDGLPNVGEVVMNLDPKQQDSDGNGVKDGEEDVDFDGLTNGDEIRNGTSPTLADSDNDGVTDSTELAEQTNPNNASSVPLVRLYSDPVSYINGEPELLLPGERFLIASSPVSYLNSVLEEPLSGQHHIYLASPLVSYLNAVPEIPRAGQSQFVITSQPVSYLNGSLEPAGAFYLASPPVSYENNAP